MDENESKLKNILSRLSELDAEVQALADFAVETPEPLETEPLETEPLETEPLETEPLEILQKGGWITNSRMENLEWRVEALDSQFNKMNSNFIKILKILEDSIEKRDDLKKTTDVGDDTDDAPDHRDVSSALNDDKYDNLVQKLRRVADGPRVSLKASPR